MEISIQIDGLMQVLNYTLESFFMSGLMQLTGMQKP
jgi:hypothetical protein